MIKKYAAFPASTAIRDCRKFSVPGFGLGIGFVPGLGEDLLAALGRQPGCPGIDQRAFPLTFTAC
jgi:hypothetical protein